MAIDLANYEQKSREATMAFWGNREKARQKQIEAGKADQGERAGVTAGKNMGGFLALLIDIVYANGLSNATICQKRAVVTLPGYFRPTKLWDLVILNNGRLVAAIELKSHVGPSFGKPSALRMTSGWYTPNISQSVAGTSGGTSPSCLRSGKRRRGENCRNFGTSGSV